MCWVTEDQWAETDRTGLRINRGREKCSHISDKRLNLCLLMTRWPPPSLPTLVVGGGVGGMSCSNRNSSQCQLYELPGWDLIRDHALSKKLLLSQSRIPLRAPQWEEEEGRALSPTALPIGESLSKEELKGFSTSSACPVSQVSPIPPLFPSWMLASPRDTGPPFLCCAAFVQMWTDCPCMDDM